MTTARLLLVDDDAEVLAYLLEELSDAGYEAEGVQSGEAALARLDERPFDLVISDVEMPGMRGTELVRALQARHPSLLVLLITAFGSIELAVQSVRAGAADFIAKPFRIEVLLMAVERALRERNLRREIVRLRRVLSTDEDGHEAGPVARSPAMRRVLELALRAARSDATVLFTGESGSGKGSVARFVHDRGSRAAAPFVQVNCAAVPATLFEAELFGVRKGAFTDAHRDRPGLMEQAAGGTLFLDEIAELPLELQPKLLQALETRSVRPVGAAAEIPVDLRLLAATNRSLEQAVAAGRFRQDLFWRLNVIRIELPPLRERPEDIELLADVFLHRAAERLGRPVVGISQAALEHLRLHPWPGNVRELQNTIERAVALTDHDTLLPEDLAPTPPPPPPNDPLAAPLAAHWTLAELEDRYVTRVLQATAGNKSEAARRLGIDRRTLYRRLDPTP